MISASPCARTTLGSRLLLRLLAASSTTLACASQGSTTVQSQTISDAGAAGQDGSGGGTEASAGGAGGKSGKGGGGGAGGLTLKDTLCDGIPNGGNSGCSVGCYEPGDTCFVQYGGAGGPSKNVCELDGGPTPVTICGGPDGGSDGGPCEPFDAGVVLIPDVPCLSIEDPKLQSALSPFGPSGFGPSVKTGPVQTVGGDGGVACCYGVVYTQTGRPLPGWTRAPLVRHSRGWASAGVGGNDARVLTHDW